MLSNLELIKWGILNLPKTHWHSQYLPLSILSTLHATRVALFSRYLFGDKSTNNKYQVPWLQALIVNIILGLGGGILSSFLFGRYVPWLASNTIIPLYSTIHFIIFYSPNDLIFKILLPFLSLINPLLIIADGVSRGFAVTSTIDIIRASNSLPLANSYVAMILGGTVAACGGGIMMDLFKLNQPEWGLQTPNFVKNIPLGIRTPFYLAIFYIVSTTQELISAQHLIQLAKQFNLFDQLESIISLIGNVNLSDAQVIVCILFTCVLFYEEYVVNSMFKFVKYSSKSNGVIEKPINKEQIEDINALNSSFDSQAKTNGNKKMNGIRELNINGINKNPNENGNILKSRPPSPSRLSVRSVPPHE